MLQPIGIVLGVELVPKLVYAGLAFDRLTVTVLPAASNRDRSSITGSFMHLNGFRCDSALTWCRAICHCRSWCFGCGWWVLPVRRALPPGEQAEAANRYRSTMIYNGKWPGEPGQWLKSIGIR